LTFNHRQTTQPRMCILSYAGTLISHFCAWDADIRSWPRYCEDVPADQKWRL